MHSTEAPYPTQGQVPLSKLHPFPNHPFKVQYDDAMCGMMESVHEYSVLTPATGRLCEAGGCEIIAGHRWEHASKAAGLETLPAKPQAHNIKAPPKVQLLCWLSSPEKRRTRPKDIHHADHQKVNRLVDIQAKLRNRRWLGTVGQDFQSQTDGADAQLSNGTWPFELCQSLH